MGPRAQPGARIPRPAYAAARARVDEILGPNTTMVSIASWADEVRRSRRHRAVALHRHSHRSAAPRYGARLSQGRLRHRQNRGLPESPERPRIAPAQLREDLMFLIHFIGDMHQPLHCADNKDKGGNDVKVNSSAADEPAQRLGQRFAGPDGKPRPLFGGS